MDMLNNSKVYFDGKSKYSFTDVSWNAKWIINNLNLKNQLIEVGATDYIELHKLAKLINSSSEFHGDIDDQIILNKQLLLRLILQLRFMVCLVVAMDIGQVQIVIGIH